MSDRPPRRPPPRVDHPPTGHRGHVPPPRGTDQPLHDYPPPDAPPAPPKRPRQAGGGGGFVNVNGRLYAPLQGLNPNNILQGGYNWLSKTDGGATFHPGLDLNSGGSCNADEGLMVVAPLRSVIRSTLFWNGSSAGEGNHVWAEVLDKVAPAPTWWHVDHLLRIDVAVGQELGPGESAGLCGRTGGWDCAHAHCELLKGPPATGFWQWPYGWSRAQVEAAYHDPYAWWQGATALVYAEDHTLPPPEVVEAMTDWQLINWVLATLYEWTNAGRAPDQQIPFDPESGLSKTWVAALRAGAYPGRPRTGERDWGDPKQGVWAEFDYQLLVYKNDGAMSWTG